MSDQCTDFTNMEMTYLVVLSVLCILLSISFAFWLTICCVIIYKNNSGRKGNIMRERPTRVDTQGIALVANQPIEETVEFHSPVKTRTFSKAKGKELKQPLEETDTPNQYENLSVATSLPERNSISFDTFSVNKKVSKVENEYQTGEGQYINIPPVEPTENTEVDELNDKDDSPLVEKEKVLGEDSKAFKPELTKKQSNPYHEITLVQGGTVAKEGIYDLLGKK